MLRKSGWLADYFTDVSLREGGQTYCSTHSNSLSNKMDNSLLAVRDINHKYIVVDRSISMVFKTIGNKSNPVILFSMQWE